MINSSGLNNKTRPRPSLFAGAKMPRLSLTLHTMPQTSTGHFKRWLVLGILIFGFMIVVALILFSL